MPGDPLPRVDADGGDLAAARPDTGLTYAAFAHDAQRADGAHEHVFDLPQVPVQIEFMAIEIHNRISNKLPGAVKGHVAAALHVEQLDAARREQLGRKEAMRWIASRSAERDDWRVLHEQQEILRERSVEARAGGGAL